MTGVILYAPKIKSNAGRSAAAFNNLSPKGQASLREALLHNDSDPAAGVTA